MTNKIVFVASHLGYPMDKTPLGGGAMVAMHLSRALGLGQGRDFDWTCLGSGPQPPAPGVSYVSLKPPLFPGESIALLSEFRYARFSRWFEKKSARWILDRPTEFPPSGTCVIVNDISEGPELSALAGKGYSILSLWHVDVVDYFNRLYLKNVIPGPWLTGIYEKIRTGKTASWFPDILKLVFEKERETVFWAHRLAFPSKAMASQTRELYKNILTPEELSAKSLVVPWGDFSEKMDPLLVEAEAQKLSRQYQISEQNRVLLTISRISPEKGLDILIKAVLLLESTRPDLTRNMRLFICGEPAFMRGQSYARKVNSLARKLKSAKIFFPGYLTPIQKQAFFSLADLFVSPSTHESYGLTIVEAMSGGCAIVSSDHYGARDLIKPDFGTLVPYSGRQAPPRALAQALERLLVEPLKLKEMGRAARVAASKMNFEQAAQTILEAALSEIRKGRRAVSA